MTSESPLLTDRLRTQVDNTKNSTLKTKLTQCLEYSASFARSDFSIGHRGAPLYYPEHTQESYIAANNMGAGIMECDVVLTKDAQLVCRHSHGDLHSYN